MLVLSVPALSQEFSAELVRQKPQNAASTKVFVSGDKIRFEASGQKSASYSIINLAQRTSAMVLPDSKSYVVSPAGHVSASYPLFHIDDPENACTAWEKVIEKPESCKKIGEDTVNGRSAIKYSGATENGDTGTAWVDRKLHFVIKWDGQKSAAELQKIEEGQQAASLFEIPRDFQKLDTAAAHKGQKKMVRPLTKKPAPPQ